MSRIELININKYYGDNHVLKDLTLTIEDGDFMTLLGPSGCGKTTTLRVISGLERPQGGVMLIDGKEYTVEDRGVGPGCIDILVPTHKEGRQRGRFYTDVYVWRED